MNDLDKYAEKRCPDSWLWEIPPVVKLMERLGAEPTGMLRAAVTERKGLPRGKSAGRGAGWDEKVVLRFLKDGTLSITPDGAAEVSDQERGEIKAAFASKTFPEHQPILNPRDLPKPVAEGRLARDGLHDPAASVWEYKNETGETVAFRVRLEDDSKGKYYLTFTYWSDKKWRVAEPDGLMPLYNGQRMKNAGAVFIHEGEKAAAFAQALADVNEMHGAEELKGHPWRGELSHAAHVGWAYGAGQWHKIDWASVPKDARVYVVADRDIAGAKAAKAICKRLHECREVFAIQFTDEFAEGFDLADPLPDRFYAKSNDADGKPTRVYKSNAPRLLDFAFPAMPLTREVPPTSKGGRPSYVATDAALRTVHLIPSLDEVMIEGCRTRYSTKDFNRLAQAWSGTADTAKAITEAQIAAIDGYAYKPAMPPGVITEGGKRLRNVYTPTLLRPTAGDASLFYGFLERMFPVESDRDAVLRWVVTVACETDYRPLYGLLLQSEMTGTGKDTLAAILAACVGEANVSRPSPSYILGDFNDWVAEKKLAIVSEIYEGHSWKAANKLKSLITEKDVNVNEKFRKPYLLDNHCCIMAMSNSSRALRIENEDRRWLIPDLTEQKWAAADAARFWDWLRAGGYGVIFSELKLLYDKGFTVGRGDDAPRTARFARQVEESLPEGCNYAIPVLEAIAQSAQPIVLPYAELGKYVGERAPRHGVSITIVVNNSLKAMDDVRLHKGKRTTLLGVKDSYLMNEAAQQSLVIGGGAPNSIAISAKDIGRLLGCEPVI